CLSLLSYSFLSTVSVFFSLTPSPPTLTLFPYTTLFRSSDSEGRRTSVAVEPMTCAVDAFNSGDHLITLAPGEEFTGRWGIAVRQDRKSTRLNSSHVSISYAVFCLKKKKDKVM